VLRRQSRRSLGHVLLVLSSAVTSGVGGLFYVDSLFMLVKNSWLHMGKRKYAASNDQLGIIVDYYKDLSWYFFFCRFRKFVVLCYTLTFLITSNMLFRKMVVTIFGTDKLSSSEIFVFSIHPYIIAYNPFIDGHFSHV